VAEHEDSNKQQQIKRIYLDEKEKATGIPAGKLSSCERAQVVSGDHPSPLQLHLRTKRQGKKKKKLMNQLFDFVRE
jgi:hypothetical protein